MSSTTPNTTTPNNILEGFDPISWGFDIDQTRAEGNILHSYYTLVISEDTKIHISCSQFPEDPQKKQEQSVELSIVDMYHPLPHIDSQSKLAQLIRAISGKSYKEFKID